MPARPLCANCRKRTEEAQYRPFCSERCKLADLGRWLSGDYRVASQSTLLEDDASSEDTSDDPTRRHD